MNRSAILAIGVFLLVGSIYVLVGPGRVDIIDGEYRFEVARNLIRDGSLQIRDPFLLGAAEGIGGRYSPYGISGSLVAVPLVAVAMVIDPSSLDLQQFVFSFTSAMYGAATAAPYKADVKEKKNCWRSSESGSIAIATTTSGSGTSEPEIP